MKKNFNDNSEIINMITKIIKESFCCDEITIANSSLDIIKKIIFILNLQNNSDIAKIGHGTNSCVYCVNNKVIKIGFYKINKLIISHPKIVKVYLKENIEILNNNNIIRVGVEIQDLVAPNKNNNINALYDVYKELRDDGILWTDVKVSNVGYVDNRLVVIDTDDCYFIDDGCKQNVNNVNNIAMNFDILYNKLKEGEIIND